MCWVFGHRPHSFSTCYFIRSRFTDQITATARRSSDHRISVVLLLVNNRLTHTQRGYRTIFIRFSCLVDVRMLTNVHFFNISFLLSVHIFGIASTLCLHFKFSFNTPNAFTKYLWPTICEVLCTIFGVFFPCGPDYFLLSLFLQLYQYPQYVHLNISGVCSIWCNSD